MLSEESRMSSEKMCESVMHDVTFTFDNFKPKQKYLCEKIITEKPLPKVGLFNPITNEWE